MPIDLIEMRENFFGEGRPAHHGDNSNTILNPTDELLLTVPVRTNVGSAALNALNNGAIAAEVHRMPVPKTKLPNVSWLRRTEYISSETPTGAGKGAYKEYVSWIVSFLAFLFYELDHWKIVSKDAYLVDYRRSIIGIIVDHSGHGVE